MEKNFPLLDVVDVYSSLDRVGIPIWIDGGWATDALLGKETRMHSDLDVAVERKNLSFLCDWLTERGYSEVIKDADKKWDIVMGDGFGREIDIHAFSFDESGNIIERDEYPDDSLDGKGVIGTCNVRCVNPYHLVQFHTRHKPKEKDFQDVLALCKKFSLEIPGMYRGKQNT